VLTGLPNRRLFQDRISGAIERARQRTIPTAVLAIDLDGFKEVNDTLGHPAGDEVLRQIAQLFHTYLRRVDTIARTGGDEFSVVLEGPITRREAEHVASALKELVETPLTVSERIVRIGASVGVAMFPDDGQTPEALTTLADARMYAAKRDGGGRVKAA
jgi:diguanylate cyclase